MAQRLEDGIFEGADYKNEACYLHYQNQGWVLLKNFFDKQKDILSIHQEINYLIDLKINQMGLSPVDPQAQETIKSNDFKKLISKDRKKVGEIYRASRHMHSLHCLLTQKDCINLAKIFMKTSHVILLPYTALRIDIPGEDQYLFPWHQDYPYTQGSVDGIVLWFPLFDVPIGHGHLELIPESHKLGIHPVEVVDPENKNKNGAHAIKIHDIERFDHQDRIAVNVSMTDLIVFNTLLVHRSTASKSDQVRWTIQLRYGNYSNSDAIKRGWPGGMYDGRKFEDDHPEFVVNPALT